MDLALDDGGDLDFSDNRLNLIDGDDAIVQHCALRLRFVRGEFFLDDEIGTPYFEKVLVKNPDLVAVRAILRKVVAETPGILSVTSFTVRFDDATRIATVAFEAQKKDGTILVFNQEFKIL